MNSMNKDELKAFLNRPYPGTEDFLQHIIFPIFGQDKFVDEYEKDYLDEPSWQKKAEAAGISHIYTLGHIKAVKPIHLFDVTVSDHVRMARNRVSLQLIIRDILKSKSGSAGAFMVFRYEDSRRHEWRFSFCYKAHEDEKSTDAKRFTFLFGPNHSCRTAAENFLNLFQQNAEGQRVKVEHIREAFSVEALSKEFFDKYREHYARFVLHATGKRYVKQANKWEERTEHAPDEAIMQAFGGDEKRVRDYVKKLLGRIVFLHFLQKKGWMGVPNGGRWGEGKFRFMYKLFEEATAEQQADFVHEVLEHLFFHALNTDRKADNDLYDTRVFGEKVRVPYLNGGLFEEDDADRCFKACTDARFPAELFRELFAFFEQYNFTIDENDPDDAQVGVDPEMLGRIFESLLEDNKEKGAFYTPKEIVQYMCRRSLTAYLQADVPDERMRKKIDEFVRTKDYDCLRLYLPLSRREQVAERLRTVKICDPAIGSGAFPMGLLRELYLCRIALEDGVRENRAKSHAEIKKEILQQNIYGVDLDRGAVDIARLRFWLSLVVDEDVPQPLPNLDYKIMQGNSLLEQYKKHDLSHLMLPRKMENGRSFSLYENVIDIHRKEIRTAVKRYYSATTHDEKERLRQEIHDAIQAIFKGDADGQSVDLSDVDLFANPNFFLWHTWFSEVFSRPTKEGFDIVIGNPPYISAPAQVDNVDLLLQRRQIIESKNYASLSGKWDLYIPFIELGLHLLRDKGICTMIVPYPLTNQGYAKKLRKILLGEHGLIELVDLNGTKIFENATVSNCIPFVCKGLRMENPEIVISHMNEKGEIIEAFRKSASDLISQADKFVWDLSNPSLQMSVPHEGSLRLGDLCYISKGMVLNADEKTARGEFSKDDLISNVQDAMHPKPYIEAKDIEPFRVKRFRFLEYDTPRCPDRLSRPTFRELYECPKLMMNCLGTVATTIDETMHYLHNHSIYSAVLWKDLKGVENKSIKASVTRYSTKERQEMEQLSEQVNLHYLLGLLNSRYMAVLLTRQRGGDYHIYPEHLRALPIPPADADKQHAVACLVKEVIEAKSHEEDCTDSLQALDRLVYELYDLTEDEIRLVEGIE